MRIGIIGYYGFHNLGDELNLVCMMDNLRKQFGDIEFLVNEDFFRDNLIPPDTSIPDVLNSCDLVVLGGGGIINLGEYWFPFMDESVTAPYIIYRVGIDQGTLDPGATEQYKRLFLHAREVTVRDHYSLDLCKKYLIDHVEIVPEAIWNHPYEKSIKKEKAGNQIGVNLRDYSPEVFPALKAFFESLRCEGYRLHFIPCQTMAQNPDLNDNSYHRMVADSGDDIMADDSSIEERCMKISEMDFCIGMRLHFLLLSLGWQIPVIALNYNSKVKGLMEEVGLNGYLIDLDTDNLADSLNATFEKMLKENEAVQLYLNSRIKDIKENSNKGVHFNGDQKSFDTL